MLLQIDGTFLFVLLSFLIFLGLMNLICYKPIMKVISEREKFYEKNNKTVSETNSKKENIEKEIEEEIAKTKIESSKLIKDAIITNKNKKANALNSKKEDNNAIIKEYQNNLDINSNEIKEQLKNEVEGYVKSLISKVLNKSSNDIKIEQQKIDEILK